jgi:DNA-binding SARP family transcriptional activator
MFSGMRFELLGPVRGWHDGTELTLGSPQQRGVLAMLLLARGRQVPTSSLIDGLWGQDVPRSATGTVRTYISRLRLCLTTGLTDHASEPIRYLSDGYVLRLGSAVLDVDLFEGRLQEARAARQQHETARAARLLHDAIALSQGTALAGIPGPYAAARRAQLTELHAVATEEKLAMDIRNGEYAAVIPELQAMLAEHPFREGLSEQLMLALYKCGRQVDALSVFDTMRRRLREDLGIDPGPALQTMHQRILQADDHLMDLNQARAARRPRTRLVYTATQSIGA